MPDRWPHQTRATHAVIDALNDGVRHVLLSIPTGGGKTQVALDVAAEFTERELGVVYYTNRKLLVSQAGRVLEAAGVEHGRRSEGRRSETEALFQISSLQTEQSKVLRRDEWQLHKAGLVIIDEAHLQTGPTVRQVIERHVADGAQVLGLSATP